MAERPHEHDPGDASCGASSRPPRNERLAGVGPDPTTTPTGVGADNHLSAPRWLFDDEEPHRDHRSSRRSALLALAAVPWIVVAVLLLRPTGATPSPGTTTDPATPAVTPSATTPSAAPAARDLGDPMTAPRPTPPEALAVVGGARTATTIADATALATLVARDWLGGAGPRAALFEEPLYPEAYVAQLAVEAVDHPAPGHVVVTVLGLMLVSDGESYSGAEIVRVAVPIAVGGDGALPAGVPWRLNAPELTIAAPRSGDVGDPTLVPEAAMALEAAGYRDIEVSLVEATEGWPFIVTADAVAPHGETRERHVVWLRMHGSQLVVAGSRPPEQPQGPATREGDQPSPRPSVEEEVPSEEGSP